LILHLAGYYTPNLGNDIKISMDGKGRALDNVFIERLWRSVKYECVYPMALENIPAAKNELKNILIFIITNSLNKESVYKPWTSYAWMLKTSNLVFIKIC
jgi:putative transposase